MDENGRWTGKGDPPIQAFLSGILVRCEKCDGCARVRSDVYDRDELVFLTDCACPACGNIWKIRKKRLAYSFLDLPLWLQTRCCGEVLWALNEDHLSYLEMYLGARVRRRVRGLNSTVPARLPKWMLAAKNREAVMRGLRRLREKLAAR